MSSVLGRNVAAASRMETNDSVWSLTAKSPTFPPLANDLDVDVLIVGGGITGLTAAVLLKAVGRDVAVIEARRIGSGVSHRSTVHLTEAIDTRYTAIESDFGTEGARLAAQSSRAAIEKVAELAAALAIPCDLLRRPGYLYTEDDAKVATLAREAEAARRAGLPVELLPRAPLPFATKGAIVFPDQAQMHIQRYLAGLATAASARGVRISESSRVVAIEDGTPCVVHLEHGPTVRAKWVFVATHAPLNRVFLQTKIAAYRSYVLAFADPSWPDGLFWDTDDPYHYTSTFTIDGASYLIVGGEDHKTGATTNTSDHFDALLAWTEKRVPVSKPLFAWSAQVEEPVDGLPFIGKNSLSEHVLVATGFSGNGTTFGTLAAMIVSDLIAGRPNPWADLYTATRVKPLKAFGSYLGENIDFPVHLVSDRLHPPEAKSLDQIRPGEGKTVRVKGQRLAVYRDPEGGLHAVSPVCTHLGCLVKWSSAERTWDCPCHGSRFSVDGAVIDGPAVRALARKKLVRTKTGAAGGEVSPAAGSPRRSDRSP